MPSVVQSARNDKMRINSQRHLGATVEQAAAVSYLVIPTPIACCLMFLDTVLIIRPQLRSHRTFLIYV